MVKRYQSGNQNLYIKEEQTTQCSDLTLWYLLAIVLSVLLRYTDSDDPIGIFWALCPLLLFDIWILITSLVSFGYCGQKDTKGLIRICISKKN
jgi:hypothetical protein